MPPERGLSFPTKSKDSIQGISALTTTSSAAWTKLYEDELALRQRCSELDRRNQARSALKSETLREWWGSMNQLLRSFTKSYQNRAEWLEPPPLEALLILAALADQLAGGVIPDLVRDVSEAYSGRPSSRGERHARVYAVLYIEAALRGEIDDRHPKKTVRETYGVTAEAVRGWIRRRDDLLVRFPVMDLTPEVLVLRMQAAGAMYSAVGRGATAR